MPENRSMETYSILRNSVDERSVLRACLAAAAYLKGGRKKRISEMSST
jgi:hypothetical protein